jgi:hypothetical protein
LRETPCIVHGLVAGAGLPKPPTEFIDIRILRRDRPQAREVLLCAAAVLAIGQDDAHAVECIGLLRIDTQHLLPCLFGQIATTMRLPVTPLVDQYIERGVSSRTCTCSRTGSASRCTGGLRER